MITAFILSAPALHLLFTLILMLLFVWLFLLKPEN
jgi:hypothetical protein